MRKTYMRNKLIKLLGGYTKKEYTRLERRYQGLLDSKTDTNTVTVANEYILIALRELEKFARVALYGVDSNIWAQKMYNVIHNNILRLVARYLFSNSAQIYRIDTTLDEDRQFINILKEDNIDAEQQFILETD